MRPNAKILGDNIALLIQRAYVPARPAASFRKGLKASFLLELRRQHESSRLPNRTRRLLPLLALAAGLLLAFLIPRALDPRASATPEELSAQGHVALAFDAGPWRAASEPERSAGIRLGTQAVAVQTSAAEGLSLFDAAGSLRLGTNSRADFKAGKDGLLARLRWGVLELDHAQPSSAEVDATPWNIELPSGTLLLSSGALRLQVDGELESIRGSSDKPVAAVFSAGAWSHRWPQDGDLSIDRGQAALRSAMGRSKQARSALGLPQARAAQAEPLASTELALRGRVTDHEGKPVPRFRIGLIQPSLGHNYQPVLLRDFDAQDGRFLWDDAPRGAHELCVLADGHAILRLETLELGSQATASPLEFSLQVGGSLRGFVFDKHSKQPIQGALVMSQRDVPNSFVISNELNDSFALPASTRSGPDGRFELTHLSSGTHELYVAASGYGPDWSLTSQVVDGQTTAGLELGLGPGAEVSGLVLDSSGRALQGAMLMLSGMQQRASGQPHFQRAITDAEGRYLAKDLPVGLLIVVLLQQDRSAAPWVKPAPGEAGQRTQLDFIPQATSTRLHGRILDAKGQAFRYQNIAIFKTENMLDSALQESFEATTTNALGHYSFKELNVGNHLIFRIASDNSSIRVLAQVHVSGAPEQELDLRLGAQGIAGQVLDARNGLAVAGAELTLWFREQLGGARTYGGSMRADEAGRYAFGDLAAGEYWVSAHAHGGLGFELSGPLQLELDAPWPSLDFQLTEGGGIWLRATDQAGRALPDCSLVFSDEQGDTNAYNSEAQTDADGVFTGQGLHPGRYQVLVQCAGMLPKTLEFYCTRNRTAELNVELHAAD